MSARYKELGFEIVTYADRRPEASFMCVECGKKQVFSCASAMSGTVGPEFAEKAAVRAGWKAHAFGKSKTYCPKCSGPKKSNDVDSELRKVIPMTAISQVTPIKEPTADQRMAIRGHLDKSFDDAAGMYLDGLSDQRVAELVGVPRVIVERIREVGYGSIKVDPVLAGYRAEVDNFRRQLNDLQIGFDNLKKKQMEFGSRIEKHVAGKVS